MALPASITTESLFVKKDGKTILDDLSIRVSAGRITGLIGPSGSGKTTLMKTMVGIQLPTSGTVLINGVKATSPQSRKRIGYVSQSPAVYTDISVEQNLKYFAVLLKVSKVRIQQVVEHVDLSNQYKQLTSSLSGGQRARLSLAIALLNEPDILILDEPTVGLDPVLRKHLWRLFRAFAEQGKTLLISSHVMDEADRCDDVLLLRDGKTLWNDTRSNLLRHTATRSTEEAFFSLVGKD